jgi:uncharacterized protein (DUF2147 family)
MAERTIRQRSRGDHPRWVRTLYAILRIDDRGASGLDRAMPALGIPCRGSRGALALCAVALVGAAAPAAAPAADGTFDRRWGKDVIIGNGFSGFEICTVASSCGAADDGGLGGEMFNPAGITVAPSGDVYVADQSNHRIQRFDADGNWELAWGKNVVTGGSTGPEVCTDAAQCRSGSDPGFGADGGELGNPSGVAVDSAGNVYVAEATAHRISKFDASGAFLRAWGLDVVDNGAGNMGVEVCTTATACQAGTATEGVGGAISNPAGVAVDSSNNVYVTEVGNDRIQKFDPSGAFLAAWGKDVVTGGGTGFEACTVAASCKAAATGGLGGEMLNPAGIDVDSTGNVYVADGGNDRIQKLGSDGAFQRAWGRDVVAGGAAGYEVCTTAASCKAAATGGLGGELSDPSGVTVDASGKVYVTDRFNVRVQRFDTAGAWELAWGKDVVVGGGTGAEVCSVAADCKVAAQGTKPGEFFLAMGAAASPGGELYVIDYRQIDKFAAGGDPPPANEFEIGKAKLNRRRGTAKVPVEIPGPGELALKGKGLKRQRMSAADAGREILKAIPLVRLRRDLEEDGRARVKLTITFTPVGGEANNESRRLLLRYEPPG